MDHAVMDASQARGKGPVGESGAVPRSTRGLSPFDEARGVLRDVLAALRNVEHLLRSPKVGSRALATVVPGLQGLCDPLVTSVDDALVHLRASAGGDVDEAIAALSGVIGEVCERLRVALDRALRAGSLDAKSRLSFESAIVRAGGELNSVRQLLDLLIRSTEHCDTELDLEELVQVAFSTPASTVGSRDSHAMVVASYVSDGSGFQASPHVFMPLLAVAIATVRSDEPRCVYLEAICRDGEPVVVSIAREGSDEGDVLRFEPPTLTPASLICAQAAARLAGGAFTSEAGRVVLSWPRAGR